MGIQHTWFGKELSALFLKDRIVYDARKVLSDVAAMVERAKTAPRGGRH